MQCVGKWRPGVQHPQAMGSVLCKLWQNAAASRQTP